MTYHQLMLENQTIFTKLVFDQLAEENLSVGQPKVLEYLFAHDGAIQKDIAEACQIEPATVTSLLTRMEKAGLIERKSKNGDKRYLCVSLTDSGKKCSEHVIAAFQIMEAAALQGFSMEEKNQFMKFLKKANENLTGIKGDGNEKGGNR